MLEMAMQVYTGPKAMVAEQEMTPFFTVTNGVPAGCPQAAQYLHQLCNHGSKHIQPSTSPVALMMLVLTPPAAPLSRQPRTQLLPIEICMADCFNWAYK